MAKEQTITTQDDLERLLNSEDDTPVEILPDGSIREIGITNLERLKVLRDYIIGMDSGSGDAKILTWAIGEIERLGKKADEEMLRVKACEHIAEGCEGWEKLINVCPSTAAVARLRNECQNWRYQANVKY